MVNRQLLRQQAHPLRLSGSIIEARLPGVTVGEVCEVSQGWSQTEILALSQVLGFHGDTPLLSLIGNAQGLSREVVICPTGTGLSVVLSHDLLGCVLNPFGEVVERLAGEERGFAWQRRTIDAPPPLYQDRVGGIRQPFLTGI
ncbi:MAG: hypothetical protein ACR5LC_12225 [Symbiopectobacterium sp.]|uniref:hypothetical protein n=1 Tax=Symbiopectobacterium sp. TaxID=2952789 RepID=UPI003F3AAF18